VNASGAPSAKRGSEAHTAWRTPSKPDFHGRAPAKAVARASSRTPITTRSARWRTVSGSVESVARSMPSTMSSPSRRSRPKESTSPSKRMKRVPVGVASMRPRPGIHFTSQSSSMNLVFQPT